LPVLQFVSLKRDSGHVTTKNLPGLMKKLRGLNEVVSEEEIAAFLSESYPDSDQEIEFESFLRVHASRRFSELLNRNVDSRTRMVRYSQTILMGLWNLALFPQEYLNLQARVSAKEGGAGAGGGGGKTSFLKSSITTLLHNINQAEKSSYVAHINTYLRYDPFLKKYLPIDPAGNQLFDLIRDGVLLW